MIVLFSGWNISPIDLFMYEFEQRWQSGVEHKVHVLTDGHLCSRHHSGSPAVVLFGDLMVQRRLWCYSLLVPVAVLTAGSHLCQIISAGSVNRHYLVSQGSLLGTTFASCLGVKAASYTLKLIPSKCYALANTEKLYGRISGSVSYVTTLQFTYYII